MNTVINGIVQSTKQAGADFSQISKDIMTNGCSVVPEFNMHECCNTHDIEYRTKGKFRADWNLLKCGWRKAKTYEKIYKRTSTRFLSVAFFVGVSIGGWIPYLNAQKENKDA